MLHLLSRALAAAIICVALAAPAAAQPPAGVMDDLVADVREAKGKIIGLAKAMPEAAWDWRPGHGIRSTKEVFVHVTRTTTSSRSAPVHRAGQHRDRRGLQDGRGLREADADREQVLAELETSFAFLEQQMAATTDARLATPSKWPKMSTRQLWIASTTHLHEHLGQ